MAVIESEYRGRQPICIPSILLRFDTDRQSAMIIIERPVNLLTVKLGRTRRRKLSKLRPWPDVERAEY